MPNIIIQNAEGQPELWENVNTVRFLNEEGGLVSYEYNSGEAPSEERPDLLPAPDGKVWVGFQDGDGSLLWNTLTDRGGSVEYPPEQPTPPEEDMEFVRWSWSKEDIRCIESDTVIAPVWKFKNFNIEDTVIKINTRLLGSSSVTCSFNFGNYDNEVAQGGQVDIDWGDGQTSTLTFKATKVYGQASHTFIRTDYDNVQYITIKRSGDDYITLGYTQSPRQNYGDNRDLYYKYHYGNAYFVNTSGFMPAMLAIQFGSYNKYLTKHALGDTGMCNLSYIMITSEHLDAYNLNFSTSAQQSIGIHYCVIPNTDILVYSDIYSLLNYTMSKVHTFAFGKHIKNVLSSFSETDYTNESYVGENPSSFVYSNIHLGLYTGVNNTYTSTRLKYFTIPWTHYNIVKYADYPKNRVKFRYLNLTSKHLETDFRGHLTLRTQLPNICPDDIPIRMNSLMQLTNAHGVNHSTRQFRGTIWLNSWTNRYSWYIDAEPNYDVDLSDVNIICGSYSSGNGEFKVGSLSGNQDKSALFCLVARKLSLNYDNIQMTSSTGKFPLVGNNCFITDELTILGEFHSYREDGRTYCIEREYYYTNIPFNSIRYNFPDTTKLPAYTFSGTAIKELNIPNVKSLPNNMFWKCVFTDGKFVIPEGVVSIGNYTLQYCQLSEIHIPSTVESIGNYFVNCCSRYSAYNYQVKDMPHIYVHKDTPPKLGSYLYDTTTVSTLSSELCIHVPKDSVDLYKSASGWSSYARAIIGDL